MGYKGTTLDWLYIFLCWDLDIADLKQLAINSITYASITPQEKVELTYFFEQRWERFLDFVIGKF